MTRLSAAAVAAFVGTVLVLAYALIGVLQVLVWNPLAAVPGLSLQQIHAELDRVGQSYSSVPAIVWAVFGAVAAVTLAVSTLRCARFTVRHVVVLYALFLLGGAPSLVAVSFAPGMQLADGFGISGYDYSPWARPLYLTSLVAMVVVIVGLAIRKGRNCSSESDGMQTVR